MCDASPPTTRFSIALVAPGWMKRTSSFAPMLKPFQLMIAFGVPCSTWSVVPSRVTVAAPPTTWAP